MCVVVCWLVYLILYGLTKVCSVPCTIDAHAHGPIRCCVVVGAKPQRCRYPVRGISSRPTHSPVASRRCSLSSSLPHHLPSEQRPPGVRAGGAARRHWPGSSPAPYRMGHGLRGKRVRTVDACARLHSARTSTTTAMAACVAIDDPAVCVWPYVCRLPPWPRE